MLSTKFAGAGGVGFMVGGSEPNGLKFLPLNDWENALRFSVSNNSDGCEPLALQQTIANDGGNGDGWARILCPRRVAGVCGRLAPILIYGIHGRTNREAEIGPDRVPRSRMSRVRRLRLYN